MKSFLSEDYFRNSIDWLSFNKGLITKRVFWKDESKSSNQIIRAHLKQQLKRFIKWIQTKSQLSDEPRWVDVGRPRVLYQSGKLNWNTEVFNLHFPIPKDFPRFSFIHRHHDPIYRMAFMDSRVVNRLFMISLPRPKIPFEISEKMMAKWLSKDDV